MTAQEIALKTEGQLADATPGEIMMNAPLLAQIDSLAKRMANAKATIPKHLAGSEGDCWAVIMQAIQWRMNPFVVAQKTHLVNGTLGYEAQLVNAVVKTSGAIEGAFKYEYEGEGQGLKCRVGATLRGESEITWGQWLCIADVKVQNSPLWKTNPPQQLGYLQVKNFARAHCPEALLGVYTPDELQEMPPKEREIGPATSDLSAALKPKDKFSEAEDAELVEPGPEDDDGEPLPLAAEQEQEAPSLTFAQVTDLFNKAQAMDELEAAKEKAIEFLAEPANKKFGQEINDLFKHRKEQLQASQPEPEINF